MAFRHTFSADGNSPEFTVQDTFRFQAQGTFGSGTVIVQEKQADGTFVALTDVTLSALGGIIVELIEAGVLRFNLSGSTSPDLDVVAYGATIPSA